MNGTNRLQLIGWSAFLLYYTASKYLAAFSGWNLAYAIQVGIIVTLTAIVPFYLTKYLMKRLNPVAIACILPSLTSILGYSVFFFVFIAPNIPNVTLAQVAPRGLIPGMVITALLLLPTMIAALQARKLRTQVGN